MAFDLSTLSSGPVNKPPRVIVYGDHGIGKSSFAAGAPNPIFIQTEDGSDKLDVTRTPVATRWQSVLSVIKALHNDEHEFQTVVLDSLDWAESLCDAYVHDTYDDKALGYGKDAVLLGEHMRDMLRSLTALRDHRNMAVVCTAHAHVKTFHDPSGESYDRYEMKLAKKVNPIAQEWADYIGFAAHEVYVAKKDAGFNKKRGVGVSQGRVLHLEGTPAYDAKKRGADMPATIPLHWADFYDALRGARGGES
jgi:hypothetical protein